MDITLGFGPRISGSTPDEGTTLRCREECHPKPLAKDDRYSWNNTCLAVATSGTPLFISTRRVVSWLTKSFLPVKLRMKRGSYSQRKEWSWVTILLKGLAVLHSQLRNQSNHLPPSPVFMMKIMVKDQPLKTLTMGTSLSQNDWRRVMPCPSQRPRRWLFLSFIYPDFSAKVFIWKPPTKANKNNA